jgi:hypothetical protein
MPLIATPPATAASAIAMAVSLQNVSIAQRCNNYRDAATPS